MRLEGRLLEVDGLWAVEVPILGVATQGHSRAEALEMIADAVEMLANRPGFRVSIHLGDREYFELGADDDRVLTALLLRRLRTRSGLSLTAVAARLGARSANAYARYEQGQSVPTVAKLGQLLAALSPGSDFVLRESSAGRP